MSMVISMVTVRQPSRCHSAAYLWTFLSLPPPQPQITAMCLAVDGPSNLR